MFNSSYDYVDAVVDEIALEGLDGITLDGLWVRLSKRSNFCLALDDASKSFIWNFVRRLEGMAMYKLPTPRKPLVIFDRYDFMDKDLGMVLEPENVPDDPYPHCAVEDTETNVRGSCSTYYTRVNVTSEAVNLSLREVERKWGLSLVVVASQSLRNLKLTLPSTNPRLEMTLMQYCLLERIGRSRYMGEVTQGKVSLQLLGEDPKALFYYRKFLLQHKLIVKQVHHLKMAGHNCSGSLLHLPRFYVERKPKIVYFTEKVILYLKSKPHHLAEYSQVREMLGFQHSCKNLLKNLLKTFDFQRYIKADLCVPYRQLYPDAKMAEWKRKGSDHEKQIRVLKLIKPDMDIREMWSKYDDNIYEDDECDASPGLLDCKDLYIDQALITQAFNVVDRAGPKGISQIELGQSMGLAKLQARVICRNLLKRGVVSTYRNDVGRQRVSRFVSLRYEKESILSVQFAREKDRMLTLLSNRPALQESQASSSTSGIKRAAADDDDDSDAERSDRVKRRKPSKKPSVASVLARLGLVQERHSASKKKQEVDTSTSRSIDGEGSVDPTEDSAMCDDASSTFAEEAGSSCEKAGRAVEDQSYGEASKSVRRKESRSGFVEDLKNLELTQESAPVTYRLLKRANLIIETVRSHKVVYDLQKLMKLISDEEGKEGYNAKMDKKSLLRLLLKLAHDGNIKIFKVYLKSDAKEKVLSFVCDPTICANHTVIQSAIEQAKMKFFIPPTHRLNKVPTELPQLKMNETSKERSFSFETSTITESMKELKTFTMKSKDKMQQYQYNTRMGKLYGLCPKFVRMKKFHQFLYYLVYAYEGDPKLDRQVALDQLAEKGTKLEDSIAQEAATIYYPDPCWKMFVAPLPVHAEWPKGWTIMCDILLRLPLSLFVEIYNITYIVPNIEEYLEHPIRRHYLLKYLPLEMRNIMMIARKYIFSIHEIAQHLCYAGLLQFGPQRLKEKDQVFVYLNRKAILLDTTLSRQGYHQVSDDIVYPVKKYEFTSMSDVDSYWYDLWNICIHTHLGGRMCMMGKDIVLEVLRHKQIMVDALKARSPDEAAANDLGYLPGDKRGAAGLDSALFAHLKRNWSWTNQSLTGPYVYKSPSSIAFNKKITELKTARLASLRTDLLQSNIFQEMTKKDPIDPSMTTFTNVIKKRPPMAKKPEKRSKPENEIAPQEKKKKIRKKQIIRTVQPKRTPKRQRRPFYDDVDKRALRRMSKLRVEWSAAEDNLLLLCKVASVYLCPTNHKQRVITFPMIRDVLHRKNMKYKNKTSRACQRRIVYMMKNISTACNVALHLEEMSQDSEIASQFKNTVAELRDEELKVEEFDARLFEKFQALVDLLELKSCRLGYTCGTSESIIIPDTVEDFRNNYEISYPRTSLKKCVTFREVKNIVDICCAVVNTVIHSSLCCMLDQYSNTYQLFQVYQQYPDNLLRSVITRLHSNQMVSLKKCYTRKLHHSGHFMPISSLPYQLSISYVNQLQTKYQFEVFHESYEMMKQLLVWKEKHGDEKGMEVDNTEGGRTAAFVELFNSGKLTFRVEVPDQIIVLDPRISDKDETFARIVQRYQDIVTSTKYRRLSNALKKHYGDAFANVNLTAAASTANSSEEPVQRSREGIEDSDYDSDVPETFDESVENMSIVHHNAIARAASRIALYMLREDRKDKLMDELQHAHDFFVVNSCKVFCIPGMNQLQSQMGMESLDKFYPISQQSKDDAIEQVKSTMVFNDQIPLPDELHTKCISSGINSEDWEKIEKLLEYAEKKKDMGVTVAELQEAFPKDDRTMPLCHVLQFLSENRVLLRTGVCSVRYIHHRFTKPWLVRSYRTKSTHLTSQAPQFGMEVKIPEEMDVELTSLSSETKECASYSMEDKRCESPVLPKDIIIDEMELHNESIVAKQKATNKSAKNKVIEKHSDQKKPEEVVEGSSKEKESLGSEHRESDKQNVKPNKKSWKKCMNTVEQDCKDSKSADASNVEMIKVHVRPWVRIDGTLNRRVLDRMLGAVLGHAMHCPSDSLTKFWERFSPALQPFLVRELIEVLVKLGCIKLKVLKLSWKTTLFSKPSCITLVDADGTENDSDIIVEPEPDAILRLGTFIGEKEYPSDFLCC